jgi:NAD(P)H-dependent flavin oxidoreductase YrpB (nitropropane dioxygenase family)
MLVSWNRNQLKAKLGIGYPIIQSPPGGLSSQRLTAAVSNFGGLGSSGAHALAPEAIKDVIAQIRSLTSRCNKGLHGKTRTGNPQPLDGRVEPAGNRAFAISTATRTRQKHLDCGRGGGPFGSSASVGWTKRQSFELHRRFGFLELIGCGNFRNRRAGH